MGGGWFVLLDTCVLIFDALYPERLSAAARNALARGEVDDTLTCADIGLWEIAMLASEGRLDSGTDSTTFCRSSHQLPWRGTYP